MGRNKVTFYIFIAVEVKYCYALAFVCSIFCFGCVLEQNLLQILSDHDAFFFTSTYISLMRIECRSHYKITATVYIFSIFSSSSMQFSKELYGMYVNAYSV